MLNIIRSHLQYLFRIKTKHIFVQEQMENTWTLSDLVYFMKLKYIYRVQIRWKNCNMVEERKDCNMKNWKNCNMVGN